MEEGRSPSPAAYLPDDLIVEILAQLPAKSLCRFKCVSRSWRRIITDPANRCRFAQTLSGFFFFRPDGGNHAPPSWRFCALSPLGVDGGLSLVDTTLSFLPPSTCGEIDLLDSCNGLLLLRYPSVPESPAPPPFYVVCNPATRDWVALPQPSYAPGQSLVENEDQCYDFVELVEIYSSETGRWVLRESQWNDRPETIYFACQMTYLNGFLHLATFYNEVASVDTKGQSWKVTHLQKQKNQNRGHDLVGHSQGRLFYVDPSHSDDALGIYSLDHHSNDCALKQSINKIDIFGPRNSCGGWVYSVVAFHPDSDLIFFYDWSGKRLVSYDMMNCRVVHLICNFGDVNIHTFRPFLPYVPLYSGPVLASPNVK
ncbi:hypothetical protein BAE44_0015209 [Dichanthelium oligosanthes]|uniref:F-box domain-containing protein n=1 Tax=Dichanthelium oligosanthes TaxID=888268 RepID=A0A1E5VF79_9POAL|nr:hypothetical protein BAE44_0015209 [Dichanthelium oligosanthes]